MITLLILMTLKDGLIYCLKLKKYNLYDLEIPYSRVIKINLIFAGTINGYNIQQIDAEMLWR